ncbi:MAG: phosphoadenylyl-sulfate reductase [Kiritimatiellae bacterium]|nr:phosphoadenylyl-sulfate reductase [Kiritimatiellia bacterium]
MDETVFANSESYAGDSSAQSVLRWSLERFHPQIALATNLQDAVLIHMAREIRPDVRVFSLDTGRLPEETYEFADEIRRVLGVAVKWFFPDTVAVERLETEKGLFSFRESLEDRRNCCAIRKVEPLRRALHGLRAWVTGMRREESVTRHGLELVETDRAHGGIVKVNPLADWTQEDVNRYTAEHGLPVNRLLERSYTSIGCACCTRPVSEGEDARAGRWWWEEPEHKECGLHLFDQKESEGG